MNDKALMNETLSALLDHEAGKIDSLELRRLARAMENDPALAATFARYARQSALMRGERVTLSADFLKGVQERLEASGSTAPAPSAPMAKARWHKIAGQWAVAASVAVLAVSLLQSLARTDSVVAPAAVAVQVPLPDAGRLGDGSDNRLLAPRVLTVSDGARELPVARKQGASSLSDCVMVEGQLPPDSALRPLALPEGVVLCRLDAEYKHCQAVSATLACRSH